MKDRPAAKPKILYGETHLTTAPENRHWLSEKSVAVLLQSGV
jgi:hypothetical protein